MVGADTTDGHRVLDARWVPDEGSVGLNRGYQFILFQPGTGSNHRTHFGYGTDGMVSLLHGEFGDTV